MKRFFTTIFVLFLLSAAKISFAQTRVQNLLIEQQTDPVGIATDHPRFSWQLSSEKRGTKQISYQILVSGSRLKLDKNIGDLWNSGAVNGDQTILIPYQGAPLKPHQYYFVKIKTVTNTGDVAWSLPARFTIGFLNADDWKGHWIGYDHAFRWDSVSQWSRLSARYFRKEFSSTKKINKAFVNIVGLGMYEMLINGTKVGDWVLTPSLTDYRKSVFSNTYDVTRFLKKGANAVGITLGNGRFFTMRQNYKPKKINNFGFPKLIFQLDIYYTDGSRQTIVSDSSWRFTADGPVRTNNEYDGEEYDATKELGDWSLPDYNDTEWLKPEMVIAPTGKIVPQPDRSMKVMKTITPVSITPLKPDVYILDLGQNFAGWLQIAVKGKRGDRVTMRFGESLQKDGSLYTENLRDARATNSYTLKGKGVETWHPRFVYQGFRYVEVTGWPGTPRLGDFQGQLIYDQMKTTGQLQTSNPTINHILGNAWWGIASNYKGMPVDCPQRNERQPWLGDRAQGAYGESFLFDNASLYAKWLDDIQQSQTAEGAIPDVAPAFWNYYSDDVTWPGVYILVADMLYHQYGDKQGITKHYLSMKKWIDYMKDRYMKDFILTKDKYGDWCVPPEDLHLIRSHDSLRNTNGELIATAYFYKLVQLMQKFAVVDNRDSDIESYKQLQEHIKEAFNKKFFHADKGWYDNNTVTANLLPLYFGMTPAGEAQRVFGHIYDKILKDSVHISTGVIGTQWLMRGLTQFGKPDIAYQLAANTTYPSWGYMIANGATTIWELWNGNTASPKMNSQNHVMLLGDLIIWMFEDIGGIKALTPGFHQIEMKPSFREGETVSSSYQSASGLIRSNWRQKDGCISWHITIPANTTAVVHLPASSVEKIKEAGKPVSETGGIESVTVEDGVAVLTIGSGRYFFTND